MSTLRDIRPVMVPIQVDKERHLNYDLNALAELQEKFGSIEKAFEALQKMDLKSIKTLLWAGLIHEDESLTEKQAGALVSFPKLALLAEAITEALSDSVPNEKSLVENTKK